MDNRERKQPGSSELNLVWLDVIQHEVRTDLKKGCMITEKRMFCFPVVLGLN